VEKMEKDIKTIKKFISKLDLVYYREKDIKIEGDVIYISFCLPRNSLYRLVEFCKLNNLIISFDCGKIEIEKFKNDKQDYIHSLW
jgi:hypothetical protein